MTQPPQKALIRHLHWLALPLLLSLLLLCAPAQASGGGGGGAPAPMTLTVNVGPFGPETPIGGGVLQVALVLQTGSPEAQHELDLYKPMVIHHVHLAINSFDYVRLRSPEGKDKLAEAIIGRLNKVLHLEPKKGITDVFFTSYILQSN